MKNMLLNGVMGFAVADALGVPVEFRDRMDMKAKPVTGMLGYGTHYQPVGTWSDDTAMTLAAVDSLKNGIDYSDMMARFAKWKAEAAYTATDIVFDIGVATASAIHRFNCGTAPLECGGKDEYSNGNGSLMRILPVALYCAEKMKDCTTEEKLNVIDKVSALTHGHARSMLACEIYCFVIWELVEHPEKGSICAGLNRAQQYLQETGRHKQEQKHYDRLFTESFASLPENAIKSSGYVVATLEAAVWCLMNTENFADCALKAVNLGFDTDTVAAVAGGLAGIIYGMEGIPADWLEVLQKRAYIEQICLEDAPVE